MFVKLSWSLSSILKFFNSTVYIVSQYDYLVKYFLQNRVRLYVKRLIKPFLHITKMGSVSTTKVEPPMVVYILHIGAYHPLLLVLSN